MSYQYYCEQLNQPSRKRAGGEIVPTKARPLRTSGPYLNTTIKGRKIA